MTEAEWLGCNDPDKMLRFVQGKASERQLRLLACACCRSLDRHGEDDLPVRQEAPERTGPWRRAGLQAPALEATEEIGDLLAERAGHLRTHDAAKFHGMHRRTGSVGAATRRTTGWNARIDAGGAG